MSMKIYTRTGDQGNTSLIGGTKVAKSHLRIESYGTIDELNSYIGLCRDLLTDEKGKAALRESQDRLFTIGAALACDPEKERKMIIPDLKDEDIFFLETEIDRMNEALPEMKNFILPGGHPAVSQLHVARCICRRAERTVVRLEQQPKPADGKGSSVQGTNVEGSLVQPVNVQGSYPHHAGGEGAQPQPDAEGSMIQPPNLKGSQSQPADVAPLIIIYLNRLSDYLFVLARYTAMQFGVAEIPWKPRG